MKKILNAAIIGGADGPTTIFVTCDDDWIFRTGAISAVVIGIIALLIWRSKRKK